MRTAVFTSAVVASVAIGAIALTAQVQSSRRIVYFSSDRERTISVGRSGSGVMSIVVPVGTRMVVSYESTTEPNLMAKPFKIHGTVQIRLLRDSEIHGRLLAEAMLTAPVAIAGEDVDLVLADGR